MSPDGGASRPGFPDVANGPGFCARGIEDWSLGQARAAQALSVTKTNGGGAVTMAVSSDLHPVDAPTTSKSPTTSFPRETCTGAWPRRAPRRPMATIAGTTPDSTDDSDPNVGEKRYDVCQKTGFREPPSSCPNTGMSMIQTLGMPERYGAGRSRSVPRARLSDIARVRRSSGHRQVRLEARRRHGRGGWNADRGREHYEPASSWIKARRTRRS